MTIDSDVTPEQTEVLPFAQSGDAPVESVASKRATRRVVAHAERYTLVMLLVGVAIFFAVHPETSDTFPTFTNLRLLISGQVLVSVLAFAMIVPLIGGNFDLSVGANLGISSITTAAAMSRYDAPLAVAIVAGLMMGLAIGTFNAIAVARLRLNSFIVTLGTATIIGGVLTWYTGGVAITSGVSTALVHFGSRTTWGLPRTGWVLIVVAVVVWYLVGHTPFGRYLHALGSNARAAELVGMRIVRVQFWSFMVSGALAGIGGVLAVATLGGATPTTGPDLLFPAISAVFLGSTCLRPGTFNVPGTIVGVFFVAICVSGLTQFGVRAWVAPVFNGVALLVAVFLAARLGRLRTYRP